MKNIKTVIIDDHSVVRDGVEQILSKTKDIDLIAKTESPDEVLKIASNQKLDVLIVDITLKGNISGIDLIKAIKERYPQIKILVMSMHDEAFYGERSIKAGAKGYIMKDVASLKLVDAIHTIYNGDLFLSEELQKRIVSKLLHTSGDSKNTFSTELLSDREFEIYQLIGNGFSTKEIASKLNLSANTVESHRNRIKTKLKFKDSAELTKHAIQWIIQNSKKS